MRYNKYRVAPVEERTFRGVVYHSKAEAIRAQQLYMTPDLTVVRQVEYTLGCPENRFVVDFFIMLTECPWLNRVGADGKVEHIDVPNGYVEEVKGMETPDFKRCKKLWRKYGPVPMVVLKAKKNGLWDREFIVPGEEAPKVKRKARKAT